MSSVTAAVSPSLGVTSVVVLWQESLTVTGAVADGANTKYVVGDSFPAATGSLGYRFDLPDDFTRFTAVLTPASSNPAGTDVDLYLTSARVVVAAGTVTGAGVESFVLGDLTAGTYELWAYGYAVTGSAGYALTVSGSAPLHAYRRYPDGTEEELVGSPFTPGYDDGRAVLWDTVTPPDVVTYYRVYDPLTRVGLTSNTVTVTGQGDGWLRDPLVPTYDVHLVDCESTCPTPTPDLGTGVAQVLLDTYARTVTGGWGSADSGQATTVQAGSASEFSTTGTRGQISLNTVNVARAVTYAVSVASVDVQLDVSAPLASGAAVEVAAVARWSDASNHYHGRVRFNPDRTLTAAVVSVVAGVETVLGSATVPDTYHITGASYRLRLQVDADALRLRVWQRGAAEPADWTTSATDTALTAAGPVGVRALLVTGNLNATPVLVTVDDLTATTYAVPSRTGPAVDRRATFQALEEAVYDPTTGVFGVVGAARNRTVAQVRRDPTTTLGLLTRQLTQARGLRQLLASGRTLWLQLAASYGWAYDTWAADYVDAGRVREGRFTVNDMTQPERTWQVPLTLARRPELGRVSTHGSEVGPAGVTYGAEVESGLTYQNEVTAGGTYLQAALGQVA